MTYVYRCPEGFVAEIEESISAHEARAEAPVCPHCGADMQQIFTTSAHIVFKGSGFYWTDHGRQKITSQSDVL